MKVVGKPEEQLFPMQAVCQYKRDEYGYGYGREVDYCGHKLEFEEEDIRKHPWDKYPDIEGVDYGVVCPICRMFITVDGKKLPERVKEQAKEISLTRGRYKGNMDDL